MRKNINKLVTKDIGFINNAMFKNAIDPKLWERITKFIFNLKSFLSDSYIIKKIGSFAMEGIFNFEDLPSVDLLALKFLNRDFYKRYDEELDGNNHLLDCLCCHHNKIIFEKVTELFALKNHIDVALNTKKQKVEYNNYLIFADSIKITIYDELKNKIFVVNIRVGLCSKELPVIICDERRYRRSFALQVTTTFRTLNNLLNKKLSYLFMKIKEKYSKSWDKKDIMFCKMKIMAQIQGQLGYEKEVSSWLSRVYKETLNNRFILEKILKNKKLHYVSHRFFDKVHKMLLLKNMKWVFNKAYPDLENFVKDYIKFAKDNHNLKEEAIATEFLYYYYDSNIYLDGIDKISYTIKKNNRLFDYIGIKKISKSVYPSDKDIENLVLLLQYYALNIYFVGKRD